MITSTPCATRPLITRAIAFSLPGMAREEKITRSPRGEGDLGMLVLGDPRQSGARLALAAGAQRQDLVGRQIAVSSARCGNPARRRDSRSRARPGRRAPWPGRPGRLRGRRRARRRRPRGCVPRGREVVTATRPGAVLIKFGEGLGDVGFRGERPSRTALVESPMSASTPSSPSAVSFFCVGRPPISGVGSIFQSPVCSTMPAGVRIASAFDSGIECATLTNSIVERSEIQPSAQRHDVDRESSARRARRERLASNNAAVNGVA